LESRRPVIKGLCFRANGRMPLTASGLLDFIPKTNNYDS